MAANFLEILQKLQSSGGEFVIVGGVAALLHGSDRVTFDVDVVPPLDALSWQKTIDALWNLGARPRIPETLDAIRNVENVKRWMDEKGMLALNMRTLDGSIEVDLLVSESENFAKLFERSVNVPVGDHVFHVAALDDLIEMKKKAGRPQDLLDVEKLEAIRRRG